MACRFGARRACAAIRKNSGWPLGAPNPRPSRKTTVPNALTEKEKQALRLILRGHDAKSAARELAVSVHTVSERLRDARRKLGVTSSREAARRLLADETPESPPKFLRTSLWGMRLGRFRRQR